MFPTVIPLLAINVPVEMSVALILPAVIPVVSIFVALILPAVNPVETIASPATCNVFDGLVVPIPRFP